MTDRQRRREDREGGSKKGGRGGVKGWERGEGEEAELEGEKGGKELNHGKADSNRRGSGFGDGTESNFLLRTDQVIRLYIFVDVDGETWTMPHTMPKKLMKHLYITRSQVQYR